MDEQKPKPWEKWRAAMEKEHAMCCRVQAVAEELHHKHGLEFEVRTGWWQPTLDWCEIGGTLQDFARMVQQTAAALGPAAKIEAEGSEYAPDRAPDLRAEWTIQREDLRVRVMVRVLTPVGCKLDPRVTPTPATVAPLHPECRAVLEELKDAGVE